MSQTRSPLSLPGRAVKKKKKKKQKEEEEEAVTKKILDISKTLTIRTPRSLSKLTAIFSEESVIFNPFPNTPFLDRPKFKETADDN